MYIIICIYIYIPYIYVYVRRMLFCRKKNMHKAGDPFSDRWSFTSSTKEKIAATWHSYVQIWIEALMLFLRTVRCSTLWAVVENPSCILQHTRQEHLAPLFFLLHRRVAVETIEFGTKLEHAKTLRSKGQNKSKPAPSPIRSMKWQMDLPWNQITSKASKQCLCEVQPDKGSVSCGSSRFDDSPNRLTGRLPWLWVKTSTAKLWMLRGRIAHALCFQSSWTLGTAFRRVRF